MPYDSWLLVVLIVSYHRLMHDCLGGLAWHKHPVVHRFRAFTDMDGIIAFLWPWITIMVPAWPAQKFAAYALVAASHTKDSCF